MRLNLVPHQVVCFGDQECIVRDMDDACQVALLENEDGETTWVSYEEIGEWNPDLEIREDYDDYDV